MENFAAKIPKQVSECGLSGARPGSFQGVGFWAWPDALSPLPLCHPLAKVPHLDLLFLKLPCEPSVCVSCFPCLEPLVQVSELGDAQHCSLPPLNIVTSPPALFSRNSLVLHPACVNPRPEIICEVGDSRAWHPQHNLWTSSMGVAWALVGM